MLLIKYFIVKILEADPSPPVLLRTLLTFVTALKILLSLCSKSSGSIPLSSKGTIILLKNCVGQKPSFP